MSPAPVLALDFDGVISDSARESFAVALRTFVEFRPGSRVGALAERDPADPEREAAYRRFLQLMPLGNRAEDYAVALEAIESGRAIEDQESYDRFFAAQDPPFLLEFHRRLYRHRDRWRDSDPGAWCEIVSPYPRFRDLLHRRRGDRRLAIATAKDRASVDLLLAHYGLEDCFAPDLICDKSHGRDKRAHLLALEERTGAPLCELTFVDDKVNHLEAVAPLGVRCVLAAWGYNGPRERERARSRGFEVADLDDAETVLFPET